MVNIPSQRTINLLVSCADALEIEALLYSVKATYRILQARPEHMAALPEIERAAADIYPEEVLPQGLRAQTSSIEDFESARRLGLLWVAVAADGSPVGFALAEDHGIDLHSDELDMHPAYQRRGIGRALVGAVCQAAWEAGHRGVTLTTYADIPWNAPWYERLGFRVVAPEEVSPERTATVQSETQSGFDPQLRVAMLKDL